MKMVMFGMVFVLAGCATQPIGVSADQASKFREQGITVKNVAGASAITLQTKGKAIGGMVLGTVAASVVASNPTSLSPQGLQEAQQAGYAASDVTQATFAAIGNNVKQAEAPAMAMAAALSKSLGATSIRTEDAAYHVDIKQTTWLLGYDSMFGSDNYRVHWQLDAKVFDSANKVVAASVCKGDGDIKQALDTWKADDYAQVKDSAHQVGEACAKQFLDDVGLHS